MGNKKLVTFNSMGGEEFAFYALVNAHTDNIVIEELMCAAISDANKKCGDIDYGLKACIQKILSPLGFEFIEAEDIASNVTWDNFEQKATLLAIRILHEGYTSEENEDGTLHVCTDKGLFKVSSICKDADVGWEYFPDDAGVKHLNESGFDQLITLLNNEHTQSSLVHWR